MAKITRMSAGRTAARRARERRARGLVLGAFAAILATVGTGLWFVTRPAGPRLDPIGGSFRLQASDGRIVTDRDFRGEYLLVYFGYTGCPDICPTTLQSLVGAVDLLGAKAAKLQPLFVTVDPRRDTPAVLARYVAAFSPRLLGLTGSAAAIARVEKEYHVEAEIRRTGAGGYTVDHSSVLYLMGPDGRFLAPLRVDSSSAELAASLSRYLS